MEELLGVPDWRSITKSNSANDPEGPFRCVYIEAAGNLKFEANGRGPFTVAVFAGQVFQARQITRIWNTGTTCTVALGGK